MLHSALAVAAALVALACGLSTFERWLARRRPHELAWTAALAMFMLASIALAAGAGLGWSGWSFRLFYLFGAILNVPFLALGTVFLLAGADAGRRATLAVMVVGAFAAGVVLVAPFTHAIPRHELARGSEVFGPLPRILAATASGLASVVIVGGAVMSAWRERQGRRRLAAGNALIALGALVTGASGLMNSVLDEMTGFAVALVLGITLIFAGFLLATTEATPT